MSQEDVMRERRDAELARFHNARMPSPFSTKVVGVSFVPGYPDNLRTLNDIVNSATLPALPFPNFQGEMAQHYAEKDWEEYMERRDRARGEPEHPVAVLIRNPQNQYDANAIEVHVPALGEEWAMIGHLTRPIAARLAPGMDAGERWQAMVESVLVHPDNPQNPGISITCARVGEEEQ